MTSNSFRQIEAQINEYEDMRAPDIKCYRINYNSKYWANVAAKVGNQCSSPVGAVFAVNALCDAYEDIAKQRDELLLAIEAIAINAEECLDFDECTAMLVQIDDYHKLMEAIASVKGMK